MANKSEGGAPGREGVPVSCILEAWRTSNGWYWIMTEQRGPTRAYGFVIQDGDKWGEFNLAELWSLERHKIARKIPREQWKTLPFVSLDGSFPSARKP